jgi:tRNA 2-selenouridine synthase
LAFSAVIDARSPAEFALDHLPGASTGRCSTTPKRRHRHRIQAGLAFEARKIGAVMAARNIARTCWTTGHADCRATGAPLVYCWRGGQRSGSLALVLAQIGFRGAVWRAATRPFARAVRAELETLPRRLACTVLCGRTGSGKSRLLQALAAQSAPRCWTWKGLACHRGSVLGGLPGLPQPTQKAFDTRIWQALRGFDGTRPVYVESESARIGTLRVPEPLLLRLRERVGTWQALARSGQWAALFERLMAEHYDPLYDRSMTRHFDLAAAPALPLVDGSVGALDAAASVLRAGRN